MALWDIGVAQSAGIEVSVVRWDGANLAEIDDILIGVFARSCDWNSDGTLLAVGASGATPLYVFSWDGTNLVLAASLALPGNPAIEGVTWSRDGRYLGLSISNVAPFFRLAEWDGANLSLVGSYVLESFAYDCSFFPQPDLPEGKFIAVANTNPVAVAIPFRVLKWDGANLSLAGSIDLNDRNYRSCHFSRDGKYIAVSCGGAFDGIRKVYVLGWDSSTLSLSALGFYATGASWPNRVRWGPNGDVIGVVKNNPLAERAAVLKFGKETGSLVLGANYGALPGAGNSCSWDHTGEFLAVGHGGGTFLRVLRWDGSNLTLAATMPAAFLNIVMGCSFYVPPLVIPKLRPPEDLFCEQKKNPTDVTDPKPEFSAVYRHY